MRTPSHMVILIGITLLAALAWAGVWFEYTSTGVMRTAHTVALSQMQDAASRDAARSRTHALALDTADERAALAAAAHADVVDVAKQIESIGSAVHVVSVSKQTAQVPPGGAAHPLTTISYAVESIGSFQTVMQAVALLDLLPVPSQLQQFDIARTSDDQAGVAQWRLNATVLLFTDAETP